MQGFHGRNAAACHVGVSIMLNTPCWLVNPDTALGVKDLQR